MDHLELSGVPTQCRCCWRSLCFEKPAPSSPTDPRHRFERELGRKTYTTPTSYLELIKLYLEMLGTQRESVSMNESRYRNGLQKLEETKVMVNELQVQYSPHRPSDSPRRLLCFVLSMSDRQPSVSGYTDENATAASPCL